MGVSPNKIRGVNLINKEFGNFVVIGYEFKKDHRNYKQVFWKCKCKYCGYEKFSDTKTLKNSLSRPIPNRCIKCQKANNKKTKWSEEKKKLKRERDVQKVKINDSAFNSLYNSYKTVAKHKGLIFNLDKEYFKKLTSGNCTYCNSEPSNIKTIKNHNIYYKYNGIDRIDSSKGYIENNVCSCCKVCNKMKLNYPIEDFINHIQKIINHFTII